MIEEMKTQGEINEEIHTALFGNPETGEKGVVSMTKEMYEAWSAVIWLGKFATWTAVIVGALGTAWAALWPGIKKLIAGH